MMKWNIDRTYITNTLSYIHLLLKNKQIEHYHENAIPDKKFA